MGFKVSNGKVGIKDFLEVVKQFFDSSDNNNNEIPEDTKKAFDEAEIYINKEFIQNKEVKDKLRSFNKVRKPIKEAKIESIKETAKEFEEIK